jgi:hypothetical protein
MIALAPGLWVGAEQIQAKPADADGAEIALRDYLRARGADGILAAQVAASFLSWDGSTGRLIMPDHEDATPEELAAWRIWQDAERHADIIARIGWVNPAGESGIVYHAHADADADPMPGNRLESQDHKGA